MLQVCMVTRNKIGFKSTGLNQPGLAYYSVLNLATADYNKIKRLAYQP